MPFVLDASVSLSWCLPDEQSEYSTSILQLLDNDNAVVSGIWIIEHANGLLIAERRGRLNAAAALRANEILVALPITQVDFTVEEALGEILNLARAEQLSAYDASYLALAMREGISLATLDNRLKAAATRVGVKIVS